MTVSTTTRKNSYTGNGSTTVYAYGFRIFSDSDIKVYVAGVLKSLTTHYLVSGAGSASGGNVTFTSGNTPASSASVVIIRVIPRTQATDYVDNSALSATSLEDTADKNLMLIQEIDAKAEDGFRFADTVVDAGTITIDKNAADRGNKLLSFDASGNLIATQEIGTSRGNWAASTAYLQRDIIKDTNNNNIYLCITAHTSSGSVPISSNTDAAKWVLLVDSASASTSATASATSATASASSATAAASSASSASSSASTASTQASNASTSASTASTQATNSGNSATASAASATSAEASAGASAFKYTFDNSTTMADPGSAGEIRYNHGTVGSVSALAIRSTSSDTGNPDVSDFIASWDDGTNSAHEGFITIRKSGTPATYAVFALTGGVTDNTAWLQLPVTHVSSNGSWSNADTMYISFTRSGQLGATGSQGVQGDTGATGARGSDAGLDMTFESTTTDTDQGVGKIWFNNGTLSSASVLYMDDVDANSANINSYVDSWDDSTTTALRGTIKVTQQASSAVFAIYNVTGAVTSASTYSKIAVTYVTGAGSFSDGDACNVDFSRTGNTGSAGSSTPADNVFRIQDNSDNTKQIAFEASSIGSGTTRTVTVPNSNVTLVSSGSIANADIDGSAAIATSKISGAVTSITSHGLATSATTDTTNAANIGSGTLPDARFPATLPAASGVNLTALNASNLGSGTVPTARLGSGTANSTVHLRGDGTWAAAGGGKVLQVLSTGKSDSFSTTSTSYTDITGLAQAITPSASSSKILVMANVYMGMGSASERSYIRLMRDSTQIGVGDQVGSNRIRASGRWHLAVSYESQLASVCFLDSPSSTSSISYHIEGRVIGNTLYVNQVAADPDSTAFFRLFSSITCFEIGA